MPRSRTGTPPWTPRRIGRNRRGSPRLGSCSGAAPGPCTCGCVGLGCGCASGRPATWRLRATLASRAGTAAMSSRGWRCRKSTRWSWPRRWRCGVGGIRGARRFPLDSAAQAAQYPRRGQSAAVCNPNRSRHCFDLRLSRPRATIPPRHPFAPGLTGLGRRSKHWTAPWCPSLNSPT